MPSDILQQIDDEKQKLSSSGEIDPSLSSSLDELNKKASESAQVMSVVESIWNSTASSGKNLHERISDLVKDFQVYESIVEKSIQGTSRLGSEYDSLGANGVAGVNRVNASLTQSLSLLQTVEREVQKYQSILASTPAIPSPNTSVAKPVVQKFANGGKVQGVSKHGDKNLARVNAGEWILTERQMGNIKKMLGAQSATDVFRMSGGIPGVSRKDSHGTPMYSTGKIGKEFSQTLDGKNLSSNTSGARKSLYDRYSNGRTRQSTKAQIKDTDSKVENAENLLKALSEDEAKKFSTELERLNKIFKDIGSNSKISVKEMKSYSDEIEKITEKISEQKKQEEKSQRAKIKKDAVEASKHTGKIKYDHDDIGSSKAARNIVYHSEVAKNTKDEGEKKYHERMVDFSKQELELRSRKNLTSQQEGERNAILKEIKDFKRQLEQAHRSGNKNLEEEVAKKYQSSLDKSNEGQLGMDRLERNVGVYDFAKGKLQEGVEGKVNEVKQDFGGNPVGVLALGAAATVAAKALTDIGNQIQSTVENMLKLNQQSTALKAGFDSTFGSGTFDNFRETMNLTRQDMLEIGPAIQDAFRTAGTELKTIEAISKNIVDNFGNLDPSKLKEALGVVKNLTSEQADFLVSGVGDMDTARNMAANLVSSGQAGAAADLLEQGVFGNGSEEPLITDNDRAMAEGIQSMKKTTEEIAMMGKDFVAMFGSFGPQILGWSNLIGKGISTGLATASSVGAIHYFLRRVGGVNHVKTYNLNEKSGGSGGGVDVPTGKGGGGWKGAGKAIAIELAAIATKFAIDAAMDASAEGSQARIDAREAEAKKFESDAAALGIYTNSKIDKEIDWDKVHLAGVEGSKWGTAIGATVGAIAGTAATVGSAGVGTLGGIGIAAGSTAAGGAIGYGIGAGIELEKQAGEAANNDLFRKEDGSFDSDFYMALVETNKNVAQLQAAAKERNKKLASSLRMMEQSNTLLDKIAKGQFSANQKKNIEFAKVAKQGLSEIGGSDASYMAANEFGVINSMTKFQNEMDAMNARMEANKNTPGASPEFIADANRDVMKQMIEATREFVEAVGNSVGEYEKIPSIIKNNLEIKLQNLKLDFSKKNLLGSSKEAWEQIKKSGIAATKNLTADLGKIAADFDRLDQADAAMREKSEAAAKRLEASGHDVRDSNGNIDQKKVEALAKKYSTQNADLQAAYKDFFKGEFKTADITKLQDYFAGLSAAEKELSTLGENLANMSEADWEGEKGTKDSNRYLELLQGLIEKHTAMANDTSLSDDIRQRAAATVEQLKGKKAWLATRFTQKDTWAGDGIADYTRDMFRGDNKAITGVSANNNSHFRARLEKAKDDPRIQALIKEIAKSEETLVNLSGLLDNTNANAKAKAKIEEGIQKITQGFIDQIQQSANFLANDPMVILMEKRKEIASIMQENLLSMGDSAGAFSQMCSSNLNLLDAQGKALIESSRTLDEMQTSLNEAIEKALAGHVKSEKGKAVVRAAQKLARVKGNTNASAEDVAAAEREYDEARAAFRDDKSVSKGERAVVDSIAKRSEGMVLGRLEHDKNRKQYELNKTNAVKQIVDSIGNFSNSRSKERYEGHQRAYESQIAAANLTGDQNSIDKYADLLRDNARSERQEAITSANENYEKAMASLRERWNKASSPEERTNIEREMQLAESRRAEAVSNATVTESQKILEAAKKQYEYKQKELSLAKEAIDIQLNLAQEIGAPMETIVELERQRVQKVQEDFDIARKKYEEAVKSGDKNAIKEAENEMQSKRAEAIKSQLGAQRSMMEKVFGNMIGSFGENAGIMGPNNLARKYGYGYGQGKDGTVSKGGKSTGGYRSRIFANNAMGNVTTVGLPQREGIGSSGAASTPGSGTSTGGQQPPVPQPGSGGPGVTGAGDKTKSDADFAKLGEKFASEKEGIEAAVFWEKKIYNVLVQDLVPGIKGIKGGNGGTGFIDGVTRRQNPRARNPVVDPNAPKNNGGSGNSGVGVGNGFTNTGDTSDSGNGNSSQSGTSTPTTPGTGGNSGQPAQTNLPSVPVADTPQGTTAPNGKFKLKNGVTLAENDYFDENTGIIYHGGDKQVSRTLNDDGTYTVDNASSYRRTLADGTILDVGMTDANMSVRKTDAMVEAATPAAPAAAGTPQTPAANSPAVSFFKNPITQPFSLTNLLSQQPTAQPQSVFTMSPQQLAERRALVAATPAAPAAAGTTANPPTSNPQPLTPPPAETPASAGTQPASTGASSQSGGGKTTIEVQVKFNSQMFEEQVKRITMQNAPAIVSTGTGADKK